MKPLISPAWGITHGLGARMRPAPWGPRPANKPPRNPTVGVTSISRGLLAQMLHYSVVKDRLPTACACLAVACFPAALGRPSRTLSPRRLRLAGTGFALGVTSCSHTGTNVSTEIFPNRNKRGKKISSRNWSMSYVAGLRYVCGRTPYRDTEWMPAFKGTKKPRKAGPRSCC